MLHVCLHGPVEPKTNLRPSLVISAIPNTHKQNIQEHQDRVGIQSSHHYRRVMANVQHTYLHPFVVFLCSTGDHGMLPNEKFSNSSSTTGNQINLPKASPSALVMRPNLEASTHHVATLDLASQFSPGPEDVVFFHAYHEHRDNHM